MQSKRSFFNRTLFRKNLSRFWPLWGGVSLAGALAPLYILLALLGRWDVSVKPSEFAYSLYAVDTYFVPAAVAAYAILCAMAVWGYLYDSRSVGLMHSLPVDRTCLFVTNTLSGLAMILIPFVVVGAFICIIALFWGFFDLMAVVSSVAVVLMIALLFFALATFSAMLTGHIFMLPAFYLLLNFLAPLLEALISSLAQEFLLGVGFSDFGRTFFLSPLFKIYSSFTSRMVRGEGGVESAYLTGTWVVAVYALVGVGLLALSWLLYRRRQSESAGNVVAFPWLRPVFRYGVALLSGLTIGRVLYELLWASLFQRGYFADLVPMCVCTALGGVLGYYAASMLLEKSLRVFRRSLPGLAAVCVGGVLLCVLTSVDVFGAERWVPKAEDVEWFSYGDYNIGVSDHEEPAPEMLEQVIGIHQAIVDDRDYVRNWVLGDMHYDRGDVANRYVSIYYHLTDGRTVHRLYDVWVTAERVAQPDTFDAKLNAFYTSPEMVRERVAMPEGSELLNVYAYNYRSDVSADTSVEEGKAIYAAALRDLDEGNIPGYDVLNNDQDYYSDLHLELEYRTWDSQASAYQYGYRTINVYPTMTNTIHALIELGCVTETELALWNEEMELENPVDTVPASAAVQS